MMDSRVRLTVGLLHTVALGVSVLAACSSPTLAPRRDAFGAEYPRPVSLVRLLVSPDSLNGIFIETAGVVDLISNRLYLLPRYDWVDAREFSVQLVFADTIVFHGQSERTGGIPTEKVQFLSGQVFRVRGYVAVSKAEGEMLVTLRDVRSVQLLRPTIFFLPD